MSTRPSHRHARTRRRDVVASFLTASFVVASAVHAGPADASAPPVADHVHRRAVGAEVEQTATD